MPRSKSPIFHIMIISILCSAAFSFCLADTIEKTFPIGPGGALSLASEGGSVSLEGTARGDVYVQIESPREIEENYSLFFDKQGDSLAIRIEKKERKILFGLIKVTDHSYRDHLKITISVPDKFNPHLKTSGGKIEAGSVSGFVEIFTSGGNLVCRNIQGTLTGRTSGGSITCESIAGPINMYTSGGHIELTGINGPLEASTSGGSVTAADLNGDCNLHTSGGHIRVENCTGALVAGTSGGSINVAKLTGKISAYTSGGHIDVELTQTPTGDCELKTSGGGITIALPRESGVNIYAKTFGGKVLTELPLTLSGEISQSHIEGKLGSGGPLVSLKTSGGNIRINPVQ